MAVNKKPKLAKSITILEPTIQERVVTSASFLDAKKGGLFIALADLSPEQRVALAKFLAESEVKVIATGDGSELDASIPVKVIKPRRPGKG